jgi:NADPH:quinone reductase-like Zn-dependent oxidoreductase
VPLTFPLIPGSDVSGIVAEVGAAVTGLVVGDPVVLYPFVGCGTCAACRRGDEHLCPAVEYLGSERDGGYAEFVSVPATNAHRLPEGISFEQAAALPVNFITAWHMLVTRGQLQAGERVLVTGASGGVGSASVQIARMRQARVLALVGSEAKVQQALDLGADAVVVGGRDDVAAAARDFSGGAGVDMAVEVVGAATWAASLAALRPEGRLVVCGAASGALVETDLKRIYLQHLAVIGSTAGNSAEFRLLIDLLAAGQLRPVIDRIYPLAEAGAAQERMAHRQQFGKILLQVSEP